MTDSELQPSPRERALVEDTGVGGEAVRLRSIVVKVLPDALWLGLQRPSRSLGRLKPGQALRLTVPRSGGALIADTTFIERLGSAQSRLFAVAPPSNGAIVQRRGQPRVPIELRILFRTVDPVSGFVVGRGGSGTVVNASSGGLLFVTDQPAAPGSSLEMTIVLPSAERVQTAAEVVRLDEMADLDTPPEDDPVDPRLAIVRPAQVAVRFVRMTAVDRDRLGRLLLAVEVQRRATDRAG